ncbi:MAG: hypothetical protein OEZ36_13770 [Spirochaetota bacterium]|nr:hypothetical protein [Spirochaetota bacterium]
MNVGFAELFIIIFIVAIVYIPQIFFCLTLQNALKQVNPQMVTLSPGKVWLLLIPIFSLGWNFYVVIQVRDSLKREYQERKLPEQDDFGFTLGMTMSGLAIASVLPIVGVLAGITYLVFWILYWVKITYHKNNLIAGSLSLNAPE